MEFYVVGVKTRTSHTCSQSISHRMTLRHFRAPPPAMFPFTSRGGGRGMKSGFPRRAPPLHVLPTFFCTPPSLTIYHFDPPSKVVFCHSRHNTQSRLHHPPLPLDLHSPIAMYLLPANGPEPPSTYRLPPHQRPLHLSVTVPSRCLHPVVE